MSFYAFEFADGVNTTTETKGGKIHTAGSLRAFASKGERDAWVADGTPYRGPRFRLAVDSAGCFVRNSGQADRLVGWSRADFAEARGDI